jgi:RNA polymerase sigma-70 factor (ECF subfamily)
MAEPQDRAEFATIVREHQNMVFSIAYHILHDRGLAEEIAQDVFLQLHASLHTIESPAHLVFWLRKVAVHRAIDCARSRGSKGEVPLDSELEPTVAASPTDPLLGRRLKQLVASLPDRTRAVIVLRYQEELSPEEIAQTLSMPVATVKSYLQRGLAMLREKVSRTIGAVQR